MSPFWSDFSSTLKATQVLHSLPSSPALIFSLCDDHSFCIQQPVISLKCKSGRVTLQLKCWRPTVLRITPHSSGWGPHPCGQMLFSFYTATRPPEQAPGLLPLTLSLHSESNGEAFPGHCTKRRYTHIYTWLPRWLRDKESACKGGAAGDSGSIPGLGRSLEEGRATHSSTLAWRVPWTEEPGGIQSGAAKSRTRLSD